MKRFLQKFLFLFLIHPTTLSFSQVANYTFSETVGTYSPIVGGTLLATTTGGVTSYDTDGNYISLPTTSRFTYNGVLITTLTMTADGALWLNPSTTTRGFGVTGPISSTGTATGVISAMGMDLRSTSIAGQVYERRWQDVGTEVVFQWQNAARYLSNTTERFSFQVRINKTTGVIRVVYGNMTTISTSTSYQPMVGLRGVTNTDFNNRRLTLSIPDAIPNWGAPSGTIAGTLNSYTCRFTSTGSCVPTLGLTFIWTPAAASSAPTNDLVCSATPISCGGSLNGTTINATNSGTGENLTCGTTQSQPGVWYVIAGTGQQMTASLCATVWDSKISIFSGPNCSTLTCVGGVDDNGPSCASSSASYSFSTSVGTNYYILVHGYSSSSNFTLSLTCTTPPTPPSNDICSNATSLPCGTSNLAGTTVNSVPETSPLGYGSQYGVWYSFVGDGNSTTISAYSTIDLGLLIMTGSGCSGLGLVSFQDNWGTFSTESHTFNTINGQTYYVYVAHYLTSSTTTGTFTISRTCVTPCNTTPSTISVNLSSTIANDLLTYTVTGGDGLVTGYEYSYNNFLSVAGTFTTTNNPWNLFLNTTQPIIYVRAVTQNGTCNSATSNIVSTTIGCSTPFTWGTQYGDYITNVTFNTINNTSTSGSGGDAYQNFTTITTNVCKGFPYTISLSGTNAGAFLGFRVWIDWNNDGDFTDIDESVFSSSPLATATGTITIPQSATNGSVKMRVVGVYNQTPPNTPCSTTFLDYGEYEEYTINIGTFTMATSPVNTDMIFVGRTSNTFNTVTNWLQYNGSGYVLATSAPNATTNVILPPSQTCASTPLTIAANSIAEVKTITIEPTAELRLNGTLSVFKDFVNRGSVTNTNTTSQRMLEFVGSEAQDHLIMEGNNTLYNLRINKPNGEVQLEDTINITNNLDIPAGDFRLNQKIVDLGTTGFVSNEGDGHSAYCDCPVAYIQRTINIGSNVTVTPGNMGFEITTNGNQMGTTIVRRRHMRAGSSGANYLTATTPSVYRIYEVIPQFNGNNYPPNGLNVDIKYTYLSHEVGVEIAAEEVNFVIWRSEDQGGTWTEKGGTIDLVNHTITYTGLQGFSWISAGPSGEVLPLDLLSFNGTNKGEYNQLNWITDNEVNFSHFELEKSRDGYNYETLTNIPSNGLSNVRNSYSFNDNNPSQINYYRLKSIDLDGSYSYSNVIVIETKLETNIGTLYPNPTSDIIKYSFNSETNEKLEIKVLDVVGKVVLRVETELEVGNNTIPISLSELPSGTYTIQIKHMNQMVTNSTKVIKL